MKKILLLSFFIISFSAKGQQTHTLQCLNCGIPANSTQLAGLGYYIDNSPSKGETNLCTFTPSIHIAIIDSADCIPFNTCDDGYHGQVNFYDCKGGPYSCRARPENYFIYRDTNVSQIRSMANFLDSVPNGNYVLAYSALPFPYSTMDTSFKNVFQRLGSIMINTLPNNVPFIFFCKKGSPASIIETVGAYDTSCISIQAILSCSLTGIDEIKKNNSLSIYPNPAMDKITISGYQLSGKDMRVEIYNTLAMKVYGEESSTKPSPDSRGLLHSVRNDGTFDIDVSGLVPGIYLIQVNDGQKVYRGKMIKE